MRPGPTVKYTVIGCSGVLAVYYLLFYAPTRLGVTAWR